MRARMGTKEASAIENSKPARNSVVPSWSSASSRRTINCFSLAESSSLDFNFSSIACILLSLLWYLLARSGFLAILAITTRLLNLLKKRSVLSETWLKVKTLASHSSTFFTHSCTFSWCTLSSPRGPLMPFMYLSHAQSWVDSLKSW